MPHGRFSCGQGQFLSVLDVSWIMMLCSLRIMIHEIERTGDFPCPLQAGSDSSFRLHVHCLDQQIECLVHYIELIGTQIAYLADYRQILHFLITVAKQYVVSGDVEPPAYLHECGYRSPYKTSLEI